MHKETAVRSERIEIRTKPEVKSIIERAAQIRNKTISAYLIESALQKAQDDLLMSESLVLNEKDRESFFSALNSPQKPNAALQSLFQTSNL